MVFYVERKDMINLFLIFLSIPLWIEDSMTRKDLIENSQMWTLILEGRVQVYRCISV